MPGTAFVGFIPVTDITAARSFYVEVLGLVSLEETPFTLVLDASGTTIRVTPVPDLRPQPFTIAGWEVTDISASVTELTGRGVVFTQYDGMGQRDDGVWAAPDGGLVAWFTDPDGNILSLTEVARR